MFRLFSKVSAAKKELSDFVKEFDVRHTLKHTLLTTGLTLIGGPWGLAIGVTYCVGDTVGEMKKFKRKDMDKFLHEIPDEVFNSLVRIQKGEKK